MTTLKQKLSTAVAWADGHPGQPYRVPLGHGLRIDVKVTKLTLTLLQLSRSTSYPSHQEWRTVLAAWPYAVEEVTPKPMHYLGRWYLMGHWPTPEKLVAL